ncbi:MAG: hypothetical protein ACT4PX_07260 [Actinomycetota bacterium]
MTALRRRRRRLGAILLATYVLVAIATTAWAPGHVRPLFDGFGSHPGQYNWVNPPREFAEGNEEPEPATAGIVLEAEGSAAASASPGDGQVLAALPPKALAPRPPDTAGTLRVTPVDASTLAPLPAGLRPEGNAYRVDVRYSPSGTPATLAQPGSLGLTSETPATHLLFSADGKAWERSTGTPLANGNGITGTLTQPGLYLAASEGPARPLAGAGSDGGGAPVVLYVLLAVAPLALGGLLLGRRAGRDRGRSARGAGPRSRRRPPAPPGGRKPKAGPPRGRAPARRPRKR